MTKKSLPQLLADNLKWLMAQNKDELGSTPKVAAKAKRLGKRASQRTVHRALTGKNEKGGEYHTNTESLDGIAAAFGIAPWQLIHPDLPAMYAQRRLSLEQAQKVQRLRDEIASLSEPEQAELFGNSEAVREIMKADPYPSERLVQRGWSAAGKAVSRKTE